MKERKVEFIKNSKIIKSIQCEVAQTFIQKTKGLMDRDELSKDKGMLFIFLFPWIRTFWMKNVKIPLDIIFINKDKKIIKIYQAPVEKRIAYRLYWSRGFCKYVIETNMGFCKKNGIVINDKIKF